MKEKKETFTGEDEAKRDEAKGKEVLSQHRLPESLKVRSNCAEE
jgi:hypothetical protein